MAWECGDLGENGEDEDLCRGAPSDNNYSQPQLDGSQPLVD